MFLGSNWRKTKTLNAVDLQDKISKLQIYYMPVDLNTKFKSKKLKAIENLNNILNHTNRKSLQDSDFKELLLCSLSLVYFFGMRLKLNTLTSRYWNWCEKRNFHKAEAAFQKTMNLLHPERSEATIKLTLKFFTDIDLWPYESFVEQVLEVVLFYNRGRTTIYNIILTDIHYVLFHDIKSARHRMRILYVLLNSDNWIISKEKLLPFVTRLLDFFSYSIIKGKNQIQAYGYLKKGFEVCLRRIFVRVINDHRFMIISTMLNWFSMKNMLNDDDALEFASLLDHAASLYKVGPYASSFHEHVVGHVICDLIGSPNALHSLIGSRLLHRLLDRQNNAPLLLMPTIYYEFSQVHLKIGKYDKGDTAFLRHHRENLHEFILKAVRMHADSTSNLKALFSIICLMVLEVPCGLTAAAAACIAMAIQDYALKGDNISPISRYWMHAIVISIMSLICWVHKAQLLYSYVTQVISRRAKEAPQLNPPLMQHYSIGRHHITWNKPTLFFEDWELRFGLWKHFQDPQKNKSHTSAPTSDSRIHYNFVMMVPELTKTGHREETEKTRAKLPVVLSVLVPPICSSAIYITALCLSFRCNNKFVNAAPLRRIRAEVRLP